MTDLVVDASAAAAVLFGEAGTDALLDVLDGANTRLMSAATLVELSVVVEGRLGPAGSGIVERFVRDGGIDVVAFDQTQADRAVEGWRRYGKGRHRASLNLGDCFTYGLAVATDCPILCTGDDFVHTDAPVVQLPRT